MQRYGIAVLTVVSAAVVMLWLNSWVPMTKSPFLMFYGAVMVSAWYGGMGPGLLATFLSALISSYLFVSSSYSLVLELSESVRLSLFLLQGILISALCEALRTANRRLEVSRLKLRSSEERYRRIIDTACEGIWTINADGRIEYVNQRMTQMLGYSMADMLDRSVFEFMDEVVRSEATRSFERCRQGVKEQFDFRYRRKDGSALWTVVSSNPIFSETGEFQGAIAMITDVSDHKRLEDKLRESEARFRRLVESNIIGVFFPDLEGHILDANDAFLDMVGYTREELRQGEVNWKAMSPPEYQALDEQKIKELKTTGICTPFEKEYIRKDGTRVPILVGAALLEGSKQQTIAFLLDLTERKQVIEALQESEERFRQLAENIQDVFWISDLKSRQLIYVSPAYEKIWGRTCESLHADFMAWINGIHPLDREQVQTAFFENILDGEYDEEYRIVRPDGTLRWIRDRGFPIWDESGEVLRVAGIAEDITDRKQVIDALRESEERFRNMADTAPVLIWMSGTDKLCNYFNKSWLDFTGRSMEQELGEGWIQGVHPDDLHHCVDTYVNAFDGRENFRMEYRLRRFDGEYRWILDTGIPRFTPEGSFLGYIGSAIDISDVYDELRLRKQAEAKIRRFNEQLEKRVQERTAQLEEANKELESFSYSVSHDLRAPLRHISGFVDLLQKRAGTTLDETSLRYLNTIVDSAKQAGKLIDDLLAFSRMGRTELRYTTINMNQLIWEVQRDIELETEGRVIHWHIDELPQISGDPSMLRLVLRNLMENALKYTSKRIQAEIEISCTENEDEFVFFVRDNGVGFDMRYVNKLFGVFQRLHSEQEFNGTGIGLANVRRIVHRHGGRTWAEGVVNNGATFYFSLPKVSEEAPGAGRGETGGQPHA
jgi:PAS domain S-box-containing protein